LDAAGSFKALASRVGSERSPRRALVVPRNRRRVNLLIA
jgi:hypothetical protein